MENDEWRLHVNDCPFWLENIYWREKNDFTKSMSFTGFWLSYFNWRINHKDNERNAQDTSMLLVLILLFNYTQLKCDLKKKTEQTIYLIFSESHEECDKTSITKYFSECEYKIYCIQTLKDFCFQGLDSNRFCSL